MFRNRPVSLALVGLFVWVTGCTSYRQIELGEVADYGEVRVTLAGGDRTVINEPILVGDSIIGQSVYGEPTVTLIDSVETTEGAYASAGKTVALVFGVTLFVAAVAATVTAATCLGDTGDGLIGIDWTC